MDETSVIIGNYSIISTIASGSFGQVYLARHSILTKRLVALKLMRSMPFSSEQEREQFVQEAQVLELLKHQYILPILDVGIHEGAPYIVSEYASGGSLRTRLQEQGARPLSLEESLTILSQLGQALQYAHEQNIIHRDIKPENILFNTQSHALLADFGLATLLATASVKHVSQAGTPRYMAPEQIQGQICKESDQYALGCVAYELFTGHAPFLASELMALLYQHLSVPPVPLTKHKPQLPAYIEQAVLKALMKQRTERYSSVAAFVAALQPPASSQSTSPASTQSPEPSLQLEETVVGPSIVANLPVQILPQGTGVLDRTEASTPSSSLVRASSNNGVDQPTGKQLLVQSSIGNATVQSSTGSGDAEHPAPVLPHIINGLRFDFLLKRKPLPRLIIAISCIVLVAIVSSSVLWITHAASSTSEHTQKATLSQITSQSFHMPTMRPTQQPTLPSSTPTQLPKLQPTAHAISQAAPVVQPTPIPQPAPAPQPTPTAQPAPQPRPTAQPAPVVSQPVQKSSYAMSYYVCGDHVALTNLNAWNAVQANAIAHASLYSGPVNGYAGPAGNPKSSPGNCSGSYQWAWNQNAVQAQWTWTDAHLPDGSCNVSVHIPSWYAGAPDAHYTLLVTSDTGSSATYAFDTQNQNQAVTTWLDLHINGMVPSISLPSSANGIYTLTLTLHNGGTPNWYLGADAIRFNCSSSASQ